MKQFRTLSIMGALVAVLLATVFFRAHYASLDLEALRQRTELCDFVRGVVRIAPRALPSPGARSAGDTNQGISSLIWQRLSDVKFDAKEEGVTLDQLISLCSLRQWLMRDHSYGNLFLAHYIDENVSRASVRGVIVGRWKVAQAYRLFQCLGPQWGLSDFAKFARMDYPKSKVLASHDQDELGPLILGTLLEEEQMSPEQRGKLESPPFEGAFMEPESLATSDSAAFLLTYCGRVMCNRLYYLIKLEEFDLMKSLSFSKEESRLILRPPPLPISDYKLRVRYTYVYMNIMSDIRLQFRLWCSENAKEIIGTGSGR